MRHPGSRPGATAPRCPKLAGVNFLRRGSNSTRTAEGVEGDHQDAPEVVTVGDRRDRTQGKGRPTPSRRQAQGNRRGPVAPAPKTQREAFRRQKALAGTKEERKAVRAERNKRMMAGDDRVLPARDRGPVRAYVRDLVDSRRHVMGLFMPLALLVFVFIVVPDPTIQSIGSVVCMVMLLTMALEGLLLGRSVVSRVRARFPDEQVKGLGIGWYAFTRATQIRRLRMPKPRLSPGETPA